MSIQRVARTYVGGTSTGETQTKWHITAARYSPREVYNEIQTLCGYSIDLGQQLRGRHRFSTAKRPKGLLCSKCERLR